MSAAEVTPEYVFTCARCRSEWKVYALDAAGSARALLAWTCPECLDLSRSRLVAADGPDADLIGGPSLAEVTDAAKAAAWLLGGVIVAGGFLALLARELVNRLP